MTTFQKKLAFAMEQQLLKEQDNDVRDREDVMEHHIINVVTPSQDPDEGSLNISLPLPNSAPISESEIHSNVSFSVASESNPLVNTTATSIQLNNNFGPSSLSSVSSVAPNREFSPQGRYIKLDERLGSGSYKDVWRAYDTNEGIEVAWNVVKLSRVPPNERKRIKTEVKLLRDIEHKNVIKYYNSWVDREKEQIVFITEIMSSGSLKDYLRKTPMIRWAAAKRWCKQILEGLAFLHANHIIHRDLKCDNIFINGTTGDIRIGDLGLSTRIAEERALQNEANRPITSSVMTCLGTPEFMAPELYEETYDEKVDIYAFGMTVLEMITGLMPYHECTSAAQIYRKVLHGELPPELKIVDKSSHLAKQFIDECLLPHDKRPSANTLLQHEFFAPNEREDFEEIKVDISIPSEDAEDFCNIKGTHSDGLSSQMSGVASSSATLSDVEERLSVSGEREPIPSLLDQIQNQKFGDDSFIVQERDLHSENGGNGERHGEEMVVAVTDSNHSNNETNKKVLDDSSNSLSTRDVIMEDSLLVNDECSGSLLSVSLHSSLEESPMKVDGMRELPLTNEPTMYETSPSLIGMMETPVNEQKSFLLGRGGTSDDNGCDPNSSEESSPNNGFGTHSSHHGGGSMSSMGSLSGNCGVLFSPMLVRSVTDVQLQDPRLGCGLSSSSFDENSQIISLPSSLVSTVSTEDANCNQSVLSTTIGLENSISDALVSPNQSTEHSSLSLEDKDVGHLPVSPRSGNFEVLISHHIEQGKPLSMLALVYDIADRSSSLDCSSLFFVMRVTFHGDSLPPIQYIVEFDFDCSNDDVLSQSREMLHVIIKEQELLDSIAFSGFVDEIANAFRPFVEMAKLFLANSASKKGPDAIHVVLRDTLASDPQQNNPHFFKIREKYGAIVTPDVVSLETRSQTTSLSEMPSLSAVTVDANAPINSSTTTQTRSTMNEDASQLSSAFSMSLGSSNEVLNGELYQDFSGNLSPSKSSSSSSSSSTSNSNSLYGSPATSEDVSKSALEKTLSSIEGFLLVRDDVEFQEALHKHHQLTQKIDKEFNQKIATLHSQREKLEEAWKREREHLVNRQDDLSKQLLTMQEKYKDRMKEIEDKKRALLGAEKMMLSESLGASLSTFS